MWNDRQIAELEAKIAELEEEKALAWPLMEMGLLGANAKIAELEAVAFSLYCNGYEKGHNDTVESSYTPPSEYPEDFPEILAEALEGNTDD